MFKDEKIGFLQALPLGIGSIIGSGILFLPSLTYRVAGQDVGLVWILSILICIPGIIFFKDMIKNVKPEDGMAGFVELGLGRYAGNSVYLILFCTVIIGMPSAAIIAGDYVQYLFPEISGIRPLVTYGLIVSCLLINIGGIRMSSKASFLIAAFLFLVALILIYKSASLVTSGYREIIPIFNIEKTYSGIVLAFWAFAGFENLTFLSGKFKRPKRDLGITIFLSILICGLLYIGLMANYAAIVPYNKIENTVGLLQIASHTGSKSLQSFIGAFAVLAVFINLVSWTAGIVSMILRGAAKGMMPRFLQGSNSNLKGTLFLGGFFLMSATIGLFQRDLFVEMLSLVSTNFLIIYVLGIMSYIAYISSGIKKIVASVVCVFLTITMCSSGYLLLYPFAIILVSSILSFREDEKKVSLV